MSASQNSGPNGGPQETFKFIGRGSSEANLKPEQLVVLQQYKRAEEVGWGVKGLYSRGFGWGLGF